MSAPGGAPPPEAGAAASSPDRRVWRNAAGIVGGNALGEVLGVLVQALTIRVLGPRAYGRLTQALAVVEVADGVASFGLNQVGPVYAVRHEERLGAFLGTVLALRQVLAILAFGGLWLAAPLLRANDPQVVRLAGAALLASPWAWTGQIPFFMRQENWRIAWLPGVLSLVNAAALVPLLLVRPEVWLVVLVFLGVRALHAGAVTGLSRRRYRYRFGLDRRVLGDLIRVGPKAGWLDMVVIVYGRASYVVLDRLGPAMVGIYAVADRIASPILRVSGALSASSLSMFAELSRQGPRAVWGFYGRNVKRILLGLAAIALVVYLVVPPIIRLFFPAYEASIPVLFVLYLGVCFMSVNQVTSACLGGLGHFGRVAVVATINLGLYALGAHLWVAPHKALGAAMATTFMEGCNMLMQVALLWAVLRARGA